MFQPIEENTPVYKKVMEQIQRMIIEGELKKGDKLPPERDLAEMMQVSRPALKQAISALEALGIVSSRQGDGNYITSDVVSVLNPLTIRFLLDNGDSTDILEFRYCMEVQLAALACVKRTKGQLKELEKLLEKMKGVRTISERQYYNNLFHFSIIKISGNKLVISIYENIMNLIGSQIKMTDGTNFYESHSLIYEAIKNQEPEKAAHYMAIHFKNKFPNCSFYDKLYVDKELQV